MNTETSTGHKGGTMCRLVRVRKCSMSLTSWCMLIRLTVCRAKATRPRGGCVRAQLTPVGITTTLVAPNATTVEMGVLLATPPSTRNWLAICTQGNTRGIAALASNACLSSPLDRTVSAPLSRSVVTM
ncbi:hypothetical protein D3C71_1258390 [compost metagenome]